MIRVPRSEFASFGVSREGIYFISYCDEGAIFHNFRKEIISHSVSPNISVDRIVILWYYKTEKGGGYMKKTKRDVAITIWITLGIVFISSFFIFTMVVGGSAGNGYQEAGKFFVGDHGEYVEVSRTIWTLSCVLEILFWTFIPLTPLGAFLIAEIQERRERKRNRLE